MEENNKRYILFKYYMQICIVILKISSFVLQSVNIYQSSNFLTHSNQRILPIVLLSRNNDKVSIFKERILWLAYKQHFTFLLYIKAHI